MLNLEINILILFVIVICYFTIFVNRVTLYDDPLIFKLKSDLIKIDDRTRFINFYASDQSFTEDKKRIYLCLRDRNNNYYPYNMLIYVACHELAHAFSSTIDNSHSSQEFLENYRNLLTKAYELGLYDPDEPIVEQYCKYH